MRAVVCVPGGAEVSELPDPQPAAGEVVVEVEACGICGSDVHLVANGRVAAGQVLGHEFSGRIAATGDGVSRWRVGQPVAVNPVGGCGHCPTCREGLPFRCSGVPNIGINAPGAFAEYVAVPQGQLVALPDDVRPEVGAYAEPLAVALRAVDLGSPGFGDAAVVYGVGSIGLNVVVALRLRGVESVVAVGRSAGRRAAAAAAGADVVLDSEQTDIVTWAREHAVSFQSSYECSGAAGALGQLVNVSRPAGRLVQVALRAEPDAVDVAAFVRDGLSLVGSCAFRPADYACAVEHLLAGRARGDAFISDRVSLEDTPATLARLRHPDGLVRVLVQPWLSGRGEEGHR